MTKVYVLSNIVPYESSEVLGVYTSKKLAIEAFHIYTKQKEITFEENLFGVEYKKEFYHIDIYELNSNDYF